MPKAEVELEQLAQVLRTLSPGELETLELLLDPELSEELIHRRQNGRNALAHGKALSEAELFAPESE